jgi:hypothetical protein
MRTALLVSAALAIGGLLGATAFNPDTGLRLHSEPLWRVFGIAAYLGWVCSPWWPSPPSPNSFCAGPGVDRSTAYSRLSLSTSQRSTIRTSPLS